VKSGKRAFDIHAVMSSIREAVQAFPKGAQHQLADEGYTSVFEQLLGCILSTRTLDEISIECARNLFGIGRTPEEIVRSGLSRIDEAISSCRFHETKSRDILEIARSAQERYGGELPCRSDVLMSFPGVGPKCANLVLSTACGQNCITVDVHVHRITNRWGYIQTKTPEASLRALEGILPEEYRAEINRILVPFGKHVCTPRMPRCSACPVLSMCRQEGVTRHA
jgi:endonuclease III